MTSTAENAPAPTQLDQELPGAVRASTQLGLSLLCTWSIVLLVRFLLPRSLGPTLFGELNFAEAFATGFMLLSTLGIDTYTMREVAVKPAHASEYFGGVHAVRAVLVLLLLAAMACVLWWRGKSLDVQLTVFFWGVTLATGQLNSTLATVLQAVARAEQLAIANVLGKAVWCIGLLGLVSLRSELGSLWLYVLPALAGELTRLLLTFPAARAAVGLKLHLNLTHTRKVLSASLPFLVATLAYSLGGPLNYWVLDALKTDDRELGWYGATWNLVSLCMLFSPLMQWVLLPVLSRAGARSIQEVNTITAYALEALLVAAIPVVLLMWLGADFWMQLAFGAAYAPAATALRIMALMIAFTYTAMLIANGLIAQGRSWTLSSMSLLSVLLAPGLGLLLVPRVGHWLGPGGEAAGAACAVMIAEVVAAAVALARMGLSVTPPRLWRALAKMSTAFAIVVLLDSKLTSMALGSPQRLLIDMLAFGALALLLRAVNLRELRTLAAHIRKPPTPPPAASAVLTSER